MDSPVDYQYPNLCSLCGLQFLTDTELNVHTLSHLSQKVHQSQKNACSDYLPQCTYVGVHMLDRSTVSCNSLERAQHSIPTSSHGSCFHQDRSLPFHQDWALVSPLFHQDHSSALGLNHEKYSSTAAAAQLDKSMAEQKKPTSKFFNDEISPTSHIPIVKASMLFTDEDYQSPHVIAGESSGNSVHHKRVPTGTDRPDAAVSVSKVQQMNVIHHASLPNYGYNDATQTEHKQETDQASSRLSLAMHLDNKSANGTDQAGMQKQIPHEFIPHEKNDSDVQVGCYSMDRIVNKVINSETNQGTDELTQDHRCMPLALKKQVSCTDQIEIQPTTGSQGKESHHDKEVTQSFESLHQLVKGTVSLNEQQNLQDSEPLKKHLDTKFEVAQQEEKTSKSFEFCKFWMEQQNEVNSLELYHYEKIKENSDACQGKQLSQSSKRDGQSVDSEGQEIESLSKEDLIKEENDKQGAEQDNSKEINGLENSEDNLKYQGLEKMSNCELSSVGSHPLAQVISAPNFIQESLFTTKKTKLTKTRGPYKKMTKVNFDPASNPEKPYYCDECNKRFKLRDSLRAHQKQGHTDERPWKCEQCGASFKKKGTLTAHYEVHTNIRPFKCESCPATFRRQTELNIHYIKHTDIKPFECELCGAAFAWKNSLKHHMKTHSSEKPYECEVCGATFKWPDSLKLHINTHSAVKEFGCDLCSARFKWKRSLRAHKLTHAAIKPFVCDLCGSQFVQRAKLKLHMAVHTNDKPFKCEHCDLAFARKDRLSSHKKVHSLHKPFKCELCDAAFRWDYGLKKHFNIHKKAEEHPCSHCGKTFICIRDAKKHEKCHTSPVTFECKECEISFTLQKELNKHNRYAHKTLARNLRKRKRKKQFVESDSSPEEPEMICVEPRVEDLMQMNRDEGTDEGEEEDSHVNNMKDVDKTGVIAGCEVHQVEEQRNVKDRERQVRVQYLNYVDVKKEVIEKPQDVEEERHIKEESLTDEDKDPLLIMK